MLAGLKGEEKVEEEEGLELIETFVEQTSFVLWLRILEENTSYGVVLKEDNNNNNIVRHDVDGVKDVRRMQIDIIQ